MAWSTIAEADVLSRMSRQEVESFRARPMDGGTTDPITELIAGAVAEARGRIAAYKSNTLDSDADTVPDGVVHHLLAIVRYRLLTRLPLRVSEDRKTEYEQALSFFTDVAKGLVAIENPAGDGTGAAVAGGAELVESRSTRITGTQMRGL